MQNKLMQNKRMQNKLIQSEHKKSNLIHKIKSIMNLLIYSFTYWLICLIG